MIGKKISQYSILEKLGEGGMGEVYLAEDTVLGRRVAVKSLKFSGSPEFNQYKVRFLREARLASTLNHPNIVSVYDYGETEDGLPYLVMELIQGKNLSDLLRQENLSAEECVGIVKQIAKALSFAHEHGIIHRDLKPSNIFVNERGEVKVLDFGLAKLLDADSYNSKSLSSATSDLFTETRQGVFMGTPSYSSPEQLLVASVDHRSDIFSLGAVFYECLSGQPAFAGKNFAEICAQVIKDDPLPPSQVNFSVAPEYDKVALKALSKKAENRYQTVDELIKDLETVMLDSPTDRLPVNQETVFPEKRSTVFSLAPVAGFFRKNLVFALGFIILTALAVYLAASGTLRNFLPARAVVQASPEFDQGVEAIRNGNFYKAKKLLETAIQKTDEFPLAHARLAEALTELGYEDRATGEILKVSELTPTFSRLSETDKLNLQAIAATVRRNYDGAIENYQKIIEKTPEENKKFAYFDLGRAFEANDETDKAIESFSEAVRRDDRFAAAYLQLGMLFGRKQETDKASEAFQKAENIYNELSDYDSVAEVFYRRGYLLNIQDKLPEAIEQMKRANEMAKVTKNASLQVRSLIQLSSIAYSLSDPNAKKYADEAVGIARDEQLDNLATSGLIDIGNIFFTRGELAEAEDKFKLALGRAQSNEWKSVEARANLSLGSLYLQQTKSAEAIRYIEPALDFYSRNNFKKEISQAQIALGYANDQIGNYDAAIKAFSEQLRIAGELDDKSLTFYAHTAIGLVLIHREKFIEALAHYDKSLDIGKSPGFESKSGYSLLNRGQILWQIGRYDESREALDAAVKIAGNSESGDRQLLAWTHLIKAESDLSENDYKSALAESQKAIDLNGGQTGEIFARATFTKGLANARSGNKQVGKELCKKAVEEAGKTGAAHLLLKSKLALAETLLINNEPQEALNACIEIQNDFSNTGSLFSQWRSFVIASEASRKINDDSRAKDFDANTSRILSQIENNLGAENYKNFISRPDFQIYRK